MWSLGEKTLGSDAASGRGCKPPLHQMRAKSWNRPGQADWTQDRPALNAKDFEETRLPILNGLPNNDVSHTLVLYFPGFFNLFFTKSTLQCSTINTVDSALYAEWSIYQLSRNQETAKRKTEVFAHPSTPNYQSIWALYTYIYVNIKEK